MKHQYMVDIRWSEEDEVYIARVPELDGVVTHGSTTVEAAKMAEEAIKLHLESLEEHGDPVPERVALENLSGKYPLRMGRERHEDVVLRARENGMSVNEYLLSLIDRDRKKMDSRVFSSRRKYDASAVKAGAMRASKKKSVKGTRKGAR